MNLVHSVLCSATNESFEYLIILYDVDLSNPSLVATELLKWKTKWEGQDAEDRPTTLRTAINECDQDFFPDMYTLLCLGFTLPVTSCENERANSTLTCISLLNFSTVAFEEKIK